MPSVSYAAVFGKTLLAAAMGGEALWWGEVKHKCTHSMLMHTWILHQYEKQIQKVIPKKTVAMVQHMHTYDVSKVYFIIDYNAQ